MRNIVLDIYQTKKRVFLHIKYLFESFMIKRDHSLDDNQYRFFVFSNYSYLFLGLANLLTLPLFIFVRHYDFITVILVSSFLILFSIFLNNIRKIRCGFYSHLVGVLYLVLQSVIHFEYIIINNALILSLLLGYNNVLFKSSVSKNMFGIIMTLAYIFTVLYDGIEEDLISDKGRSLMTTFTSIGSFFLFAMFSKYFVYSSDLTIKQKLQKLVQNVFPQDIANRLQEKQEIIADRVDNVTILFNDLVGFTEYSESVNPEELVQKLNGLFSMYDEVSSGLGLEKIKTIGDSYMLAGGLYDKEEDYIENSLKFAIITKDKLEEFNKKHGTNFQTRTGIHIGTVIAGVIGTNKLAYDVWGDAVNVASRLETSCINGKIHISEQFYNVLDRDKYSFTKQEDTYIKGKGTASTYFLDR